MVLNMDEELRECLMETTNAYKERLREIGELKDRIALYEAVIWRLVKNG